MINNRGRVHAAKYMSFFLLFVLLYIVQTTPQLFTLWGVKPMLLVPAAVVLAMYEGEFTGGLFGALAGMLCDLGGFSFYGLYSVLLLLCAAAAGLLVIYLMHCSLRVALLLTLGSALLPALIGFYFDYGLWAYEGISSILLSKTLPGVLYTTAATPVFFWMFGKLEAYFESKVNV